MIHERKSKRQDDDVRFCYGGWDRNLEPGIRYGPVIRDTYVIECCTGGFGSVIINGMEFPVKAGDCYILLPGDTVIHTADTVNPRSGVFCSVDGLRIGRYLAKAGITSQNPFAPKEAFAPICKLVEKLVRMKDDMDAGLKLRQMSCIYEILGELLRCTDASGEKSDLIQKALNMMETCYHEPLTVEIIAAEVGLERCYFSTQFKAQTGQSPYRYLTQLRIRKACTLIEHTGCSVGTAASAVGIPPENFSRLFKQWMQMTPAQYRRRTQTLTESAE